MTPYVSPLSTLTHHTHTLTSHDAVCQHEDVDVRREGAENEGSAPDDATSYADSATSELVRQRTNHRPCNVSVNITDENRGNMRGSFKLFPESPYFRETQSGTFTEVTFPLQ